jgi:hypothetical protein
MIKSMKLAIDSPGLNPEIAPDVPIMLVCTACKSPAGRNNLPSELIVSATNAFTSFDAEA